MLTRTLSTLPRATEQSQRRGNPIFQVKQSLSELLFQETLSPSPSSIVSEPEIEKRNQIKQQNENKLAKSDTCQKLVATLWENYQGKEEELKKTVYETPSLKIKTIFDWACHSCVTPSNKGIGVCKRCVYFDNENTQNLHKKYN